MGIPQRIYDYLCIFTCTFAVDFVGKFVKYVKENHEIASDTKTIYNQFKRLDVR